MTIEYRDDEARFRDIVSVEAAEGLIAWLEGRSRATVDLSECTHLHTANLQVLMALQPRVRVWPMDTELAAWLMPILAKS